MDNYAFYIVVTRTFFLNIYFLPTETWFPDWLHTKFFHEFRSDITQNLTRFLARKFVENSQLVPYIIKILFQLQPCHSFLSPFAFVRNAFRRKKEATTNRSFDLSRAPFRKCCAFHRSVGERGSGWVVKKWARLASNPPVLNEFSFAGAREPGRKGRRERAGPRLGEGRDGRWTGALEGIVAVAGRLHPRIGTGREPRPESVTRENGQGKANFFFLL